MEKKVAVRLKCLLYKLQSSHAFGLKIFWQILDGKFGWVATFSRTVSLFQYLSHFLCFEGTCIADFGLLVIK